VRRFPARTSTRAPPCSRRWAGGIRRSRADRLSAGQRQRSASPAPCCKRHHILLADEPTSSWTRRFREMESGRAGGRCGWHPGDHEYAQVLLARRFCQRGLGWGGVRIVSTASRRVERLTSRGFTAGWRTGWCDRAQTKGGPWHIAYAAETYDPWPLLRVQKGGIR